jgi:hypothetical protein
MTRHRLGIAVAVVTGSMLWAQPSFAACGSWQKRPAAPGIRGVLSDVSATSANDVWAVGTTPFRDGSRTLAERWNGAAWKHIPTPSPGRRSIRQDQLVAIAAITPTDAWAIGTWGINDAPLLLHWDGAKWQRHLLPWNARHAQLFDIGAISASDVWAVGVTERGFTQAVQYNGTKWRNVDTIGTGRGPRPELLAVAGSSRSDVWAVGQGAGPLVEHWNGFRWHLASHSRKRGREVGVTTTSTTDAWGVGTYKLGSAIDHWNGTSWTVVLKTTRGPLLAVAASAATDVWVVGSGRTQVGPATAHWNGTTWTQAAIPTIDPSTLRAIVNVPTTTTYWAVGDTEHHPASSSYRTPLIESRC